MAKKIMKEFVMTEISTVDRPAQKPAKMTIMKRDISDESKTIAKSLVAKYDVANRPQDFKTSLMEHAKMKAYYEAYDDLYCLIDPLKDTLAAILSDPALSEVGKEEKLGLAVNDFLAAVKIKIPDIAEDIAEVFEEMAGSSGEVNPDEGDPMSETVTKAVEAATKELNEKLEKALADLEVAKAEAALSDDEKAFVAKMDAKEKADFAALSPEEKKKKMEAVKKNDEVVVLDGTEIRKSENASYFAIAKRLVDEQARVAKAEEITELARLEKRAADEFNALPGTDAEKALVLKRLAEMPKAEAATLEAIMKAAQENNKGAFETRGIKKGVSSDVEVIIEEKATAIMKRDSVSKAIAIGKAWEENPDLYAQYEAQNA